MPRGKLLAPIVGKFAPVKDGLWKAREGLTPRMHRLMAAAFVVTGLCGPLTERAPAEVTAQQVRQAIERGVAYLFQQQREDGSWRDPDDYAGGVSALCTLALLNAGAEARDARMQKALAYLRRLLPERTYVVALQTMVLARLEPEQDRQRIVRNVSWLERSQRTAGPDAGGWSYQNQGPGGGADESNSQFALLALHEAERVGVVAQDQTWRRAASYWERRQLPDGSWGYAREGVGTGSMTCAGIASLTIAADRVQAGDARVDGARIECCLARKSRQNDRIARAVKWLGQHYTVTSNPHMDSWWLYYLYGLERAGRLTARRFIPLPPRPGKPDQADWFRDGAEVLVRAQDFASGAWTDARDETMPAMGASLVVRRSTGEKMPTIGASFALLFLSKGRWPVLLAKLRYGAGDDWNRSRSDAANLTRYVERRWKRDLTWQVIALESASVEDLTQAPVLYLCGSQSPLTGERAERQMLAQKLRDYLDRGGFLLAEANCGCGDFDQGFRALMRQAFPEPEHQLRLLEPEHPIWFVQERIEPRQLRPLWGIEFACRTSVIYAPPDPPEVPRPSLSCLWELSRPGRGVQYRPAVQEQIDAALSLGMNVLAYAINDDLKTKDALFQPVAAPPTSDPVERNRIDVAALRHPGECSAAPRALANLIDAFGRELNLRAHVRPELLDITDAALFDYPILFMHGRRGFHLTELERRRLRVYIERGGMLLADAICTSKTFTESFRREMAAIFPDHGLQPIAAADPLWSTAYGGFDLRTVSRRDPQPSAPGPPSSAPMFRQVPPELEGIKLADHWGVVFSPYDLSCALEKENASDCHGYTRQDAARIGLNVLLYAIHE